MDEPVGTPPHGPEGPRISVLISADRIARRRREMAEEISADHDGQEALLMVCVLQGSMPFFVDLSREMTVPIEYGYVGVASYLDGQESSGKVELTVDVSSSIEGRDVLLVEDIVDSGRTLAYLRDLFAARRPRTLRVAALLDKPSRRAVPVDVEYRGFEVPDRFVVGYGLDYGQKYRNLPYVGVIEDVTA